jgi:thiamine biosynthesis lipoprotein
VHAAVKTEAGLARSSRELMGTVASIAVPERSVHQDAVEAAFARLHDIDARFSPYIPESEISRIGRGDLQIGDAHPEVATVLQACEALRVESEGRFSAWGFRVDGRLDPSGYVKGWAIDEAAAVLRAGGLTSFVLSVGGDLYAAGAPDSGVEQAGPARGWGVGVVDPADAAAIVAPLSVRDRAVATSGLAERGAHIIDARSGAAALTWRSLTVVHPSAARADAAATIGILMGDDALAWIDRDPAAAALGVYHDGRLAWTPRMDQYLAGREIAPS